MQNDNRSDNKKAKRRHQIITAEDLREYLSTQDDFDLELYVYRKAKEFGISATHGGTYQDPVTNKRRQYDIRAAHERANCKIRLAIECKSLQPTYPLLLSRIPRAEAESFHQLVYSIDSASVMGAMRIKLGVQRVEAMVVRGKRSIYTPGEFVAKAITQVGRNEQGNLVSGDGAVFDKWSQALASADELVSLAEDGHKAHWLCTFVIPILVVSDGTLWVADYSEDGHLVNGPVQVDESVLFVGRDYGGGPTRIWYTISHLHIFTKRQIGDFFGRLVNDAKLWQQIFRHLPSG